jgi:Methyltransferase domain
VINPWLRIPLAEYEGHMALPSIGQAQMLADRFGSALVRCSPASVALIGCAGGNGLDGVALGSVRRVVAVDINSDFAEMTRLRYAGKISGLEVHCADVQSELLRFEPVDLMYAALIFEYVDVPATLATLRRNCRANGMLATVLQLPHADQDSVSPSPFESLRLLAPVMKLVAPLELCEYAVAAGFAPTDGEAIVLPSGKQFWEQNFRAR